MSARGRTHVLFGAGGRGDKVMRASVANSSHLCAALTSSLASQRQALIRKYLPFAVIIFVVVLVLLFRRWLF